MVSVYKIASRSFQNLAIEDTVKPFLSIKEKKKGKKPGYFVHTSDKGSRQFYSWDNQKIST